MTEARESLAGRLEAANIRTENGITFPADPPNYKRMAADVLAWLKERLTREKIARAVCEGRNYDALHGKAARYCMDHSRCFQAADAILALIERKVME